MQLDSEGNRMSDDPSRAQMGQLSPDGKWLWDGAAWQPVGSSAPAAREILQQAIAGYVRSGFQVLSQTDYSAQLVKPKKFGCVVFAVLLILGVLPGLIYIGYYAAKRDQSVYLQVDSSGRLIRK